MPLYDFQSKISFSITSVLLAQDWQNNIYQHCGVPILSFDWECIYCGMGTNNSQIFLPSQNLQRQRLSKCLWCFVSWVGMCPTIGGWETIKGHKLDYFYRCPNNLAWTKLFAFLLFNIVLRIYTSSLKLMRKLSYNTFAGVKKKPIYEHMVIIELQLWQRWSQILATDSLGN